ncbi:YdbH domain-containing protein [Sphingomonas tabacisoli]|uniref:YdbH domain-containing protein n=1 Tax=Sphingomonas tabacisoli TaxID=2249466 RepID=A0ABW4I3W2_9SPHN
MAEADLEPPAVLVRRRRGWRVALIVLLGLVAATLVALWLARKPIAADLIDRELARRGVPARYVVKRIGLRTQRLEGLSIGDPRAPDLTADWVEVDLIPTFGTPQVREIRASGVRLRGSWVNGRLSLGAVDRLLGPPSGKPFRLPDLRVGLTDARLALATPSGPIAVQLDGKGNLASGFVGRYVAAAPALAIAGCGVTGSRLGGSIETRGGRPHFVGPVSAAMLTCSHTRLASLAGSLDARLEPGLDGWNGLATLASGELRAFDWSASGARVQVDFAGDAKRTSGMMRLAGLNVASAPRRVARAELGGRYLVESGRAERIDEPVATRATNIRFEGGFTANGLALADIPRLEGVARSLAATPLGPLAQGLARFAGEAGRAGDVRGALSVATRGGAGSVRIASAELRGGGGALRFAGGEGVRFTWPGALQPQVDGRLVLAGPNLPQIVADLHQNAPGAPVSGLARMQPFEAGGSRVALAPVRFQGGRFATVLEASGPLAGGRFEGVRLPLEGRLGTGGLVLNPRCAPLSFDRLTLPSLTLAPARLQLCPAGGALFADGRFAGVLAAPRLRGTLGTNPLALAAQRVRFDQSGFRIAGLDARLGSERVSHLAVADLSGDFGLAGRFAGASGQIGRVPLLMRDATGRWSYKQGALAVSGAMTLADEADLPRFNPLVSHNFTLRLQGQRLAARGDLHEPQSGARVVSVNLRHDLGSGTGNADLDVPGVRFGSALQPERLTRLTLGVIADVNGNLSGSGRIAWNGAGVSSTGLFHINAASLAAPFGPATGVKGDIRFTDLLGLVTAPGQTLTVATVNPGILVEEGVVHYRVLPDFKLAVESARWPLAGGVLTLRPTVLDFSAEAERHLTFDVAGLDAAKFINKLEFGNLNATGIFDGTLPMIFDRDGGRVVGGSLTSQGGGTLAYVGEVSNANLGIWGGIAFDALKAIAYRNMTIKMNGRLDGEMVSEIRFSGVSRGSIRPVATGLIARVGGQLARQVQRMPFIFNIRIQAPFRGLIASARSFSDPSLLIQDQLGPAFQSGKPVIQPLESEKKP